MIKEWVALHENIRGFWFKSGNDAVSRYMYKQRFSVFMCFANMFCSQACTDSQHRHHHLQYSLHPPKCHQRNCCRLSEISSSSQYVCSSFLMKISLETILCSASGINVSCTFRQFIHKIFLQSKSSGFRMLGFWNTAFLQIRVRKLALNMCSDNTWLQGGIWHRSIPPLHETAPLFPLKHWRTMPYLTLLTLMHKVLPCSLHTNDSNMRQTLLETATCWCSKSGVHNSKIFLLLNKF